MVRFTQHAWLKLQRLLELAAKNLDSWEIQGFGRMELDDGNCIVSDVDMPVQVAQSAHIDTNPQDYARWQEERFGLRQGMTEAEVVESSAESKRWRFWWHSHGKSLGTTYSTTDDDTLKTLAESVGTFFFGAVFTEDMKNSAYVAAIQAPPVGLEGVLDSVHLYTFGNATPEPVEADNELNAVCEEMFKKVTKKSPVPWSENDKKGIVSNGMDFADVKVNGEVMSYDAFMKRMAAESGPAQKGSRKPKKSKVEIVSAELSSEISTVKTSDGRSWTINRSSEDLNRPCHGCGGIAVTGFVEYKSKGGSFASKAVAICINCNVGEDLCALLAKDEGCEDAVAAGITIHQVFAEGMGL